MTYIDRDYIMDIAATNQYDFDEVSDEQVNSINSLLSQDSDYVAEAERKQAELPYNSELIVNCECDAIEYVMEVNQ